MSLPELTWRFAREALPFFVGLLAIAATAWALGWPLVALGSLLAAFLALAFFRDPERRTRADPGVVLAPADGRVVRVLSPAQGRGAVISIFLSIFNVHINRVPVSGQVVAVERSPGGFKPAFREDASERNAHVAVRIETPWGIVECVQIVGLLARRIMCRLKPGDRIEAGQRYGLIQFGSRVDVRLPATAAVLVEIGRRTRAGVTVLAHLGGDGPRGAAF
jgi:phosphatidylserine decarboxylase